jgi:hypothetical protein
MHMWSEMKSGACGRGRAGGPCSSSRVAGMDELGAITGMIDKSKLLVQVNHRDKVWPLLRASARPSHCRVLSRRRVPQNGNTPLLLAAGIEERLRPDDPEPNPDVAGAVGARVRHYRTGAMRLAPHGALSLSLSLTRTLDSLRSQTAAGQGQGGHQHGQRGV